MMLSRLRSPIGVLVAMLFVAGVLGGVAMATTGDDTTAPPKVEASASFVIGSAVQHQWAVGKGWATADGQLTIVIDELGEGRADSWKAEAVQADDYRRLMVSGVTAEAYRGHVAAEMSLGISITDYEDDAGGGSVQIVRYDVTASNEAGTTVVLVPAGIDITQEDGTNARGGPEAIGTVTTKGNWRTANCDCFLGGKTIKNKRRWNWVKFTVTVVDGQRVAVVMPMAPNRGQARIKLDGISRGKVDTYSEVKENRVIMWQTPPLTAGTHTVRVVNLGTEGHPRIDIDAFLITRPPRPWWR